MHWMLLLSCLLLPITVDGAFTPWTTWTACSTTCGGGESTRERSCTDPAPRNGSKECDGPTTQAEECNTEICSVDGVYTPWTTWTTCSKSCGGGETTRERYCIDPAPQNGGKECEGPTTQAEECSKEKCSVDGAFTPWTTWTACSKTCSGGERTRERSCTNPAPRNGGKECEGPTTEPEECNKEKCSVDDASYAYTPWTTWTACSKLCSGGETTRERSCAIRALTNVTQKNVQILDVTSLLV